MAGSLKVLVVDDDADYQASVRLLLEHQGYRVVQAESAKNGLEKLVEHNPDIIILDIMMESPVEGYCVTHAVKHQPAYAQFRNIPIIMVSSIDQAPDERYPMSPEADLIRPDHYLTKPLDMERLLEVLQRLAVGA
jgi:twitching motility two-component system response regulator PilG